MHDKQACSFCGKPRKETKSLFEGKAKVEGGSNVLVCDECVELFHDLVVPPSGTFSDATTQAVRETQEPQAYRDAYNFEQGQLAATLEAREQARKDKDLAATIIAVKDVEIERLTGELSKALDQLKNCR
jgi:hypothetical protein